MREYGCRRPLLLLCVLVCIDAAPPHRETADEFQSADKQGQRDREREEQQRKEIAKYVKYMGYLETVLTILQATPQWKEVMQTMTQEEMRKGKIADMVDKLDPHVVQQLVKAKLLEMQRLEHEIKEQMRVDGGSTHNIKVGCFTYSLNAKKSDRSGFVLLADSFGGTYC
ncbi:unnamed protein product [Gongylonema pulchrum]|uniref:PABC domain-containing protein n=1 Tax=Gongylonema pulchrum TaxID=637853 RepID=A0A183EY35_9BILA|nr:unnamed protein product [Gongylonema pulchrum]